MRLVGQSEMERNDFDFIINQSSTPFATVVTAAFVDPLFKVSEIAKDAVKVCEVSEVAKVAKVASKALNNQYGI